MCRCLLVRVSERLHSDTDRHHYTLSCFFSPSARCHSVFSLFIFPWLGCLSALQFSPTLLGHHLSLSIFHIFVSISLSSHSVPLRFVLTVSRLIYLFTVLYFCWPCLSARLFSFKLSSKAPVWQFYSPELTISSNKPFESDCRISGFPIFNPFLSYQSITCPVLVEKIV